jgi:hypothetical protein
MTQGSNEEIYKEFEKVVLKYLRKKPLINNNMSIQNMQ